MTETCPLGPFSKLGHESEFTSLATGKLPTHQYQTHTYANVATLNLVRGREGEREEEGKAGSKGWPLDEIPTPSSQCYSSY